MQQERPVGDVLDLDARRAPRTASTIALACAGVAREDRDVADLGAALDADEVDRAEQPPASAIARRAPANAPGWFSSRTRSVALNEAEGWIASIGLGAGIGGARHFTKTAAAAARGHPRAA